MKQQQDNENRQTPVSHQLKQRIITGTAIGIIGLFVLCLSNIQWLFRMVITLLSIGAGVELINVYHFKGRWLFFWVLSALAAVASAANMPFYYPMISFVLTTVLCAFGALIIFMERQQCPPEPNFLHPINPIPYMHLVFSCCSRNPVFGKRFPLSVDSGGLHICHRYICFFCGPNLRTA